MKYGNNFIQFICKNLLKVHARRHSEKRLYVLDENNPNSFDDKKNDPIKNGVWPNLQKNK